MIVYVCLVLTTQTSMLADTGWSALFGILSNRVALSDLKLLIA